MTVGLSLAAKTLTMPFVRKVLRMMGWVLRETLRFSLSRFSKSRKGMSHDLSRDKPPSTKVNK